MAGDVTPRAGLDDLVNSLYFAGVPVAVVSTGARRWVAPLVRQLIGDGIAETIVTPDDLTRPGREPDLHGHALWEFGLAPEAALAVAGTPRGLRAARAAKLATLVVTTGYSGGDFTPGRPRCARLEGCSSRIGSLHRRWWAATTGCWPAGGEQLHRRWQAGGLAIAARRRVASAGTLTVIQYFPWSGRRHRGDLETRICAPCEDLSTPRGHRGLARAG